jgi:hypothetical protein
VLREWHSLVRMPTVPFGLDEIADEKRETTGELKILTNESFLTTVSSKPEAIVRPLRRREPSDDDNRPPDLQDLEAQIIDKLTKLEKPQKAQKESIREFDKKPIQRWSQSRESKKSSRDVSEIHLTLIVIVIEMGKWKTNVFKCLKNNFEKKRFS